MGRETYLYLIIEEQDGPVKIGVSTNPWARIIELQQGNGRKLRVANAWKFATRNAAFDMERNLKHRLARYSLVGEWYRLDSKWAQAEIILEIEDRLEAA